MRPTAPHAPLPALLLALLLAPPAAAVPRDDDCPEGMIRNEDTEGHCCWEGQAYSAIYHRCVGLAECPGGLLPSADGEGCVTDVECDEGQVETGDGCCWPGQTWQAGACAGAPRCPEGRVARGTDCVALPPRPPAAPLPYVPVAPADAIRLEPGRYTRGSPAREPGRFNNERSQPVTLTRAVLVKRTEVTRREWRMLVGHDPSRFAACGLDCPVERVSWYEALAWLNRLSEAEGLPACYTLGGCAGDLGGGCWPDGDALRCAGTYTCAAVGFSGLDCPGYRLPTEAEWERAARAALDAAPLVIATPNHAPALDPVAWYAGNSGVDYPGGADCAGWPGRPTFAARCGPRPVATRAAAANGAHDLLGNVGEWVWDAFGPYGRRPAVDPVRHVGVERVVRGGSWADGPAMVRPALRARAHPATRTATVGFRWARTWRPEVVARPPIRDAGRRRRRADAAAPDAAAPTPPPRRRPRRARPAPRRPPPRRPAAAPTPTAMKIGLRPAMR
ncbi:MAG: SUMF1/EgtB/PvdO family nonheme iron enzyme [Myxococcales bacterium]|nr:SUMF1/EgtB/PvdO family nonheme iron enzyme [Myxococcales bacterium]